MTPAEERIESNHKAFEHLEKASGFYSQYLKSESELRNKIIDGILNSKSIKKDDDEILNNVSFNLMQIVINLLQAVLYTFKAMNVSMQSSNLIDVILDDANLKAITSFIKKKEILSDVFVSIAADTDFNKFLANLNVIKQSKHPDLKLGGLASMSEIMMVQNRISSVNK